MTKLSTVHCPRLETHHLLVDGKKPKTTAVFKGLEKIKIDIFSAWHLPQDLLKTHAFFYTLRIHLCLEE